MFGLGMPEILLILAIALMVIGPKKLPEVAKTLGRAMGEFKKAAQDFKKSMDVESSIKEFKEPATTVADEIKSAAGTMNPLSTDADGTPLEKSDIPDAGARVPREKADNEAVPGALDPFPGTKKKAEEKVPVKDDTTPLKDKDEKEI